jgi:hypothetical protein
MERIVAGAAARAFISAANFYACSRVDTLRVTRCNRGSALLRRQLQGVGVLDLVCWALDKMVTRHCLAVTTRGRHRNDQMPWRYSMRPSRHCSGYLSPRRA